MTGLPVLFYGPASLNRLDAEPGRHLLDAPGHHSLRVAATNVITAPRTHHAAGRRCARAANAELACSVKIRSKACAGVRVGERWRSSSAIATNCS